MRVKEKYARITLLDFFTEKPIQNIEGKVTTGTINLTKDSPMRRTGSLTFVVDDPINNNVLKVSNLISINKKVKVEIGLKNFTNEYKEESIIWFPEGVFILTGVSVQRNLNSLTLSLSLKDKMCLLNGDVGGIITAATNFESQSVFNKDGKYIETRRLKLFDIIYNLVSQFGGEQLGRILINDIPDLSVQAVKWAPAQTDNKLYLSKIDEFEYSASLNKRDNSDIEVVSGDLFGYELTETTCPSKISLVANPGDSVCSVLDKIKSLGNYEYFYDVYGNFIFQQIRDYSTFSKADFDIPTLENNSYVVDREKGVAAYVFDNQSLITSFTNNPQYNMIKNDFVVWGKKKINDIEVKIRYHLAIDTKPQCQPHTLLFFVNDKGNWEAFKAKEITTINPEDKDYLIGADGYYYKRGNEYFLWKSFFKDGKYTQGYVKLENVSELTVTPTDWRTELYFQGVEDMIDGSMVNPYYKELKYEWPRIYDVKNGQWKITDRTAIEYFLDFIDSHAPVGEFSVSNIGQRSKVVSQDQINCLFAPIIPDRVIIRESALDIDEQKAYCRDNGLLYVVVDDTIYQGFSISPSYFSAFEEVKNLLSKHTSYNEAISVVCLPVYYLEPNTRITVIDPQSNIFGDYIINSFQIPLDAAGTMTLNCSRALVDYGSPVVKENSGNEEDDCL